MCALAVFALGNGLTALAPSYPLVLAARIVAVTGAALYTAGASATAARLAGPTRRGRAIAIMMLGLTSSLVLGTPLGTAVGAAVGWRATLWLVTGLGALAAAAIAARLPALRPGAAGARGRLRELVPPLRNRAVRGLLIRTFVVFVGIYIPYTYFSAVYAPATAGDGDRLAVLLLVFGLAGPPATSPPGFSPIASGPRRVVITATLLLTVMFALVPILRGSLPLVLPMVVVTGSLSFSVTTPQQHEIIALVPDGASLVTALYQSVLYLAVSASGALGAASLHLLGAAYLAPLAAIFVLAAALTTVTGRGRGDVATRDAVLRRLRLVPAVADQFGRVDRSHRRRAHQRPEVPTEPAS